MKDKAAVIFRRLSDGEVLGEIVNEEGVVIHTRNFGKMTEQEYRNILRLLGDNYPDLRDLQPIELTLN